MRTGRALVVGCLLSLVGCATTPPPVAPMPSRQISLVKVDRATQEARRTDPAAYRRRIEERAFKRGVRIIWINPPRARGTYTDPVADMTPPQDPFRYQPDIH